MPKDDLASWTRAFTIAPTLSSGASFPHSQQPPPTSFFTAAQPFLVNERPQRPKTHHEDPLTSPCRSPPTTGVQFANNRHERLLSDDQKPKRHPDGADQPSSVSRPLCYPPRSFAYDHAAWNPCLNILDQLEAHCRFVTANPGGASTLLNVSPPIQLI